MSAPIERRAFVKGAVASALTLGLGVSVRRGRAADGPQTATQPAAPTPADLAQGTLGKLKVSRMLLGGNLLTHYTHSRDLQYVYNLTAHYNTDQKILDTLALAETHGINALVIHTAPQALNLLARHRKQGGKIKWIICPTTAPDDESNAYGEHVQRLADQGADAVYLWGVHADRLAQQGKIDAIERAVQAGWGCGIPSGVGAHDLNVVHLCEQHGIKADFYIKTFHHHRYPSAPKPAEIRGPHCEVPGYWCQDPEATARRMLEVRRPWIAFKVMAAGAIPPEDAFHHAFQNGADFVLAGMFDFEIADDVQIVKRVLATITTRQRPWCA